MVMEIPPPTFFFFFKLFDTLIIAIHYLDFGFLFESIFGYRADCS